MLRSRFSDGRAGFVVFTVARNIGRARRWSRYLLDRAGHEAGRGNVVTATVLVALYLAGM